MSATLTKAPRAGAQATQTASVELPEKLFPGKSELAGAFADYQKASQAMEEARGHLARAETDEQSALSNLELSDQECSDRVAVSQRSISIYRARVSSREAAVSKSLKEVKEALYPACNEYSNLCQNEREKRSAIMKARIIEAGQLVGSFSFNALLEHSSPIQAIRILEIPSQSVLFCDSAEQITGIARRILAGYEAIAAKQKEQI
jgi:hypothetical protein